MFNGLCGGQQLLAFIFLTDFLCTLPFWNAAAGDRENHSFQQLKPLLCC
jgi:hypothetical protein